MLLRSPELQIAVPDFFDDFVERHSSLVQNEEAERSWYFEEKSNKEPDTSKGYIHYGTYGFESDFIDNKTRKRNYRRQVNDIEQIPLFYEFWCPEKQRIGFLGFQSFQGRSCIQMVLTQMRTSFEKKNRGYSLRFSKLLPANLKGSGYYSAPVKSLRLIKRGASTDIADGYIDKGAQEIDFQIIISARRSRSLGKLSAILGRLPKAGDGLIAYGDMKFPEAVAEIKVGTKVRRVGIFGIDSDAGVIDLTDAVSRGSDGHPKYESMVKESDDILRDFAKTILK
jgi:hypothetical protein